MGWVVMKKAVDAQTVLSLGSVQTVIGTQITVSPFITRLPKKQEEGVAEESTDDSN
jgi:hypothetical protein